MKKDTIFKDVNYNRKKFEFNSEVTEVFQDMINRSIPIYKQTLEFSAEIISKLCTEEDLIYDLGCSDGALTRIIDQTISDTKLKIIGIDSSEHMVNNCLELSNSNFHDVSYKYGNIEKLSLLKSKVIVMNYVLQFIAKEKRSAIVSNIYKSITPGGGFIFSEKINANSDIIQEIYDKNFTEFKLSMGYTIDEIENKQDALKNVLFPNTLDENLSILRSAGFRSIEIINKWHNFCTILCLK